jgi:radical SAM superfamily enzyme YgiQ (UPF0313 family)
MKKNILLIFPPTSVPLTGTSNSSQIATKGTNPILPPLGLLYLATPLLDAGYNVEVVDFNAVEYNMKNLKKYLQYKDVVGITVLSFNREQVKTLIQDIKTLFPTLPIITGGPDLSLHPRLFEGSSLSVIGEAENRIVNIVDTVIKKGDFSQLSGVIFKDSTGKIKKGKPYIVERNLDKIKFPARQILQNEYGLLQNKRMGKKIATIITSRGCPFNCRFCAHNAAVFQKYRERSVENVLDEIEEIYKKEYEILGIVDDNFTGNKRRALRIMEGIIKRKIKLRIGIEGRVDAANEELYKVMREAGVRVIFFGIESGVQEVLDFYNKRTTIEQSRYAVELANKYGILTVGAFMIGAPIETEEHFRETIKFANNLNLDFATFWVLEYTYGSELWEEAYNKGLIKENEFNVPAGKEKGLSKFTTKELENLCIKAFKRFYLRPMWGVRLVRKFIKIGDPYLLKLVINLLHSLMITKIKNLIFS